MRAPTVCRHSVSGTISLPLSGCFSPFPHGTGSLSVTEEYLGLEGGPPMFRQDFTCPALLKSELLSTCTGLSPTKARLSIRFRFLHSRHWPGPRSLATTSGVSVDVLSSRYLDVSVPWVCFHTLWIHVRIWPKPGFPHSEIYGSKLVRSSPKLIAAYHVLHRLSAPRHPPNALKSLDRSHYQCPSVDARTDSRQARNGMDHRRKTS